MKAPKTLKEVADAAAELAAEAMNDVRRVVQVHEAANALGKTIAAAKTHLIYAALAKKLPGAEWSAMLGSLTMWPDKKEGGR